MARSPSRSTNSQAMWGENWSNSTPPRWKAMARQRAAKERCSGSRFLVIIRATDIVMHTAISMKISIARNPFLQNDWII